MLVRQKGQLAHIRGEQIVLVGLPAHLGRVHEPGVGDQDRPGKNPFNGEQHPVVPIHIGLQVMKDQHGPGRPVQGLLHMRVKPAAALATADIPHQPRLHRRQGQHRLGCQDRAHQAGVPR